MQYIRTIISMSVCIKAFAATDRSIDFNFHNRFKLHTCALELHITFKFMINVECYDVKTCLQKYMYCIIFVCYLKVELNYKTRLYLNNGLMI